ncbi:MAG: hypothetical protein RRY38_03525, partial [Oscillospiraceae bacterium]
AHGALYMMGAFLAWMGLEYLGINYWAMLLLAPLVVGVLGILIERLLLREFLICARKLKTAERRAVEITEKR